MSLVVASCSYEAAKWAVEHWHYSERMPRGAVILFGVWERSHFVGSVVYGRGATDHLCTQYGLDTVEGCELVRVALKSHETMVSQILAKTIQTLKVTNPRLRLVVSFADPSKGHHGGIYQASNWVYSGVTSASREYWANGRMIHARAVGHMRTAAGVRGGDVLEWLKRTVDPAAKLVITKPKYRYLFPLDRGMRKQIAPLALPYPSADEDSRVSRPTSGGESRVRSPASALQS